MLNLIWPLDSQDEEPPMTRYLMEIVPLRIFSSMKDGFASVYEITKIGGSFPKGKEKSCRTGELFLLLASACHS